MSNQWPQQVLTCEPMTILGVRQRFSFSKGPHPKTLWEGEFMKRHAEIKPLSTNGHYWGLITPVAGNDIADYTAGMSVGPITNVPAGLVVVQIPAGLFVEFEFDFKDIGESGKYALETWLPASKYELDPAVPAREIVSAGRTPTRLRVPVRERSPCGELKVPAPADLKRGARWQVENVPLPIAFRAAMNVLGTDLGREVKDGWSTDPVYETCLVASGEAFDFPLAIHQTGHADQHFRQATAVEIREACRRMLSAVCCDGEVLEPAALGTDVLRARITHAIGQARRPVILVAPSNDRVALVTAYEQHGAVLHGWVCDGGGPSILFEPDQRRELSDWHTGLEAVVILGERHPAPNEPAYREWLTQAVRILQRTELREYRTGPALYEAWAVLFRREAQADDAQWLDPAIWDLAERRHYANVVLNRIAPAMGNAGDDLRAAGREFVAIHDAMWEINRIAGGKHPGSPLPKLIDPAAREQIAAVILRCRDRDLAAAQRIEAALEKSRP